MGTNQEAESEPEDKQIAEETGPTEEEKETPAEHPQDAPPPEDVDPLNTYKWHTGAKAATLDGTRGEGGETASTTIEKMEKTSTTKWKESEPSPTDTPQKGGGGALFRKYIRTVSQKLKRPRLLSRNSTSTLLQDAGGSGPAAASQELARLSWAPPQDVPIWDINNCVLEDGQILITPEEEPVMWTRNRVSSCLSNLSMQNLADVNMDRARLSQGCLCKENIQIGSITTTRESSRVAAQRK
ncbi:unnamed protein product [Oncorhynchus mykiss]|uniref:Uncharacterized protein n=1 Tax=Oncorhynchus mykiss TaxID=8022 RepID=A0A060WHQ6_ONCMY|nr:unnamed protein product [Oncorhynchus mykiss]